MTSSSSNASPSTPPSTDRRRVVAAIVGCAALVTLGAWAYGLFDGMIDLRVYRMGGSVLLDRGSLYDAQLPGSGLPFTYPPFAAIAMLPLGAVPWGVALVLWTTISVLCIALIWRAALPANAWTLVPEQWRDRRIAVLAALTAVSLLLEPVWQTIQFGQINLLLTAMILLDLVRPAGAKWRGFWVGVTIGVKLTPLPFLAFLLITKQWRAFRNALLGLAATMAIGFAVVPNQSWEYWTVVIRNANRVGGLAYTANQSFMGFLSRLGDEASWVEPVWFLLSAVFGLLVLWLARRYWLADERVTAISVMALAVLYASPVSWSHHWVWIIPLGISLIRAVHREWGTRPALATGILWYGLFVLRSIWWIPFRDDRELNWTFWQSIPGNSHLLLGLLAFLTLAYTSRSLPRQPA
ncbi:glycosyltransferase 87 family protein [Kribbella sp. CA-293567]|uniref:glycosyltransferase 87 family protein n=1 Tax=Kribbella sp. CA-293567 TaxID=3002436 RepID=UPI0022DDB524|nr:glycosyltransferase 87 family protein [Kribbella sp. CA-293567]WBQ03924.1 glycosyltransferase 87 family protein [Kribbella sp. CA-293567]